MIMFIHAVKHMKMDGIQQYSLTHNVHSSILLPEKEIFYPVENL